MPARLLDQELADQARVPRGAARDQHAALDVGGQVVRHLDVELHVALLLEDAAAHRVDDRLRLLVDLLQEEVLVAALLRRDRVPGDHLGRALDRLAVEGGDDAPVGGELGDLAVLEEDHAAGVLEHRRDVGRDEVLAVAEAEDDRRGALGGHQPVGLALGQDDDRERALELRDGAARGLGQAEALRPRTRRSGAR